MGDLFWAAGWHSSLLKAEIKGTLLKEVLGIQKNHVVLKNENISLEMLFIRCVFDFFTIYLHTEA